MIQPSKNPNADLAILNGQICKIYRFKKDDFLLLLSVGILLYLINQKSLFYLFGVVRKIERKQKDPFLRAKTVT